MDLNTTWFLLFGVLITGYAILDGFDLGVGVLHLFAKSEKERRIHLNAIGPVWDGNEVWLLTGGGALFAAFPIVYATVFSGFYIALILVLASLIARAVSLEFRGKVESEGWKKVWDFAFGIGSLLAIVLFGVAVGNVLRGLPIDSEGRYLGGFLDLLNPYSILIGVLSLALMVTHGASYLTVKTEGDLRDRMVKWASIGWVATVILYIIASIYTIFEAAYLFEGIFGNPLFYIFMIILLAAIIYFPLGLKAGRYFRAFLSSCVTILAILGLAAVSLFPRLVPSSIDLAYSLTIYNASSSHRTLTAMLIIALIGMPFVIAYTFYIYRVFMGKTVISEDSY